MPQWTSHLPPPCVTLSFIVWTRFLLLRLHYCHTINISSLFSPAAFGCIVDDSHRGGKTWSKGMRLRERERKLKRGTWMGYHKMTHRPKLISILIRSCLRVLHDKWSFQIRHSAFKPFVSQRVEFKPENSSYFN